MADPRKLPGPPAPPQWDLPALEELRVARARVRLGDEEGRIVLFRSPLQAVREAVEQRANMPQRGQIDPVNEREEHGSCYDAEAKIIALSHVRRLLDTMPRIRGRAVIAWAKGARVSDLQRMLKIRRADVITLKNFGIEQVRRLLNDLGVLDDIEHGR